ncbi:MAG: hypothetical protein AB7G62_01375 [Magnetospirillum sp.]
MNKSEEIGPGEKKPDQNKRKQGGDPHDQQLAAKIKQYVGTGQIGANHHDKDEPDDVQYDEARVQGFLNAVHRPSFSLTVTLTCLILCASVPLVAVFFSLTFVVTILLLAVLAFLNKDGPWGRTLDILSRGRLIAMLAAVALYPPLSNEQVRAFVAHPLTGEAPAGLLPALAFAMLCGAQTAIAPILMLEAIPPRRVYATLRRLADALPAGMARWLRHRIALGEHRFGLGTGSEG